MYRGLKVAPPCVFSPAVGAGDGTVIGRFVWNRQFLAAALLTAQGKAHLPLMGLLMTTASEVEKAPRTVRCPPEITSETRGQAPSGPTIMMRRVSKNESVRTRHNT
jgi:hypothetical protein